MADPIREEATSGLNGFEVVKRNETVRWIETVTSRLEDLAKLEGVITRTTINSNLSKSIIEDEGVSTIPAGNLDILDSALCS